jgi:hypothetical protein
MLSETAESGRVFDEDWSIAIKKSEEDGIGELKIVKDGNDMYFKKFSSGKTAHSEAENVEIWYYGGHMYEYNTRLNKKTVKQATLAELYEYVLDLDFEVLFDIYNQVQLYKTYSDSIALSIQYKLYVLGLELVDDGLNDVSIFESRITENIKNLRLIENRRYEALMRSNGWELMKLD